MTVPASLSKCAHPRRSNTPSSPSTGFTPGPCITPSTETCVMVVSFMVCPFSRVLVSGAAQCVVRSWYRNGPTCSLPQRSIHCQGEPGPFPCIAPRTQAVQTLCSPLHSPLYWHCYLEYSTDDRCRTSQYESSFNEIRRPVRVAHGAQVSARSLNDSSRKSEARARSLWFTYRNDRARALV
jgi:hypothetical protein